MTPDVLSGRWGKDKVAHALDALPWVLIWSFVSIISSWATLRQREQDAREGKTTTDSGSSAVLHITNTFGLAAMAVAVRQTLYIRSPFLQLVTLHAFLILFFQWLVSWSAVRSYSRSVIVAGLTVLEGILSTLLTVAFLFSVGMLVTLWANTRTAAEGTIERWRTLFATGPSQLLWWLMLAGILLSMLVSHVRDGGIVSSWMANFLPPLLLVAWMVILHMAGTSRVPSQILPEATPRTMLFRITLVMLMPVLAITMLIVGGMVWLGYLKELRKANTTKLVPPSLGRKMMAGQTMFFLGIFIALCVGIFGISFLGNRAKLIRWLRYGVMLQSLGL